MLFLQGHTAAVQALAYAPDGQTLASSSDDGTVRLWDVVHGEECARLPKNGYAPLLAWSPEGRTLAIASSDHRLRLWDVARGAIVQETRVLHCRGLTGVSFSPDGNWFALGVELSPFGPERRRAGLYLWRMEESKLVIGRGPSAHPAPYFAEEPGSAPAQLRWAGPIADSDSIWSLAFTPDGQTLVTGTSSGHVDLWQVGSARRRIRLNETIGIRALTISPDGCTIAAVPGREVKLWSLDNPERPPRHLRGHQHFTCALAFTPDSQLLATGGWDSTVRLWEVASRVECQRYDWQLGRINALALAPDGMTAAVGGDHRDVIIWDLER